MFACHASRPVGLGPITGGVVPRGPVLSGALHGTAGTARQFAARRITVTDRRHVTTSDDEPAPRPPATHAAMPRDTVRLATIVGVLGVVFGDIGTSPIYTLQTVFNPADPHPVPVSVDNVYGVVSLIFWSVVIIVTVTYVLLAMRADIYSSSRWSMSMTPSSRSTGMSAGRRVRLHRGARTLRAAGPGPRAYGVGLRTHAVVLSWLLGRLVR
jgi:hypothetical protein